MRRATTHDIALAVIVACAFGLGAHARAQTIDQAAGQGPGSLDLERLRPGLDADAILDVEGGKIGDGLDVGLWLNGALDPLTVSLAPGGLGAQRSFPVVDDRVSAHVLASFAITRGFSLGAELPVVLYQSGPLLIPGVAAKNALTPAGLDDLRVLPKLALLQSKDGAPLDLAVAAHVTLPTSVPRHRYIGDGLPTATPELDLSMRFGDLRVDGDVGVLVRAPSTFGGAIQGDEVGARLGAAYALGPVEIAATINQAVLVYPVPFAAHDNPGEAMLGVVAHLGDFRVSAAAGTSVLGAPGTPRARAVVGLAWSPAGGCADKDGDGVCDAVDACVDQAEDKDGFEDADGCPDVDNDKDGVLDASDACPNEPGPAGAHGCPDADMDGVPDSVDKCYAVAGRADHGGCPLTAAEDRDHDGIPNELDKCPDQAEDFDGVRDDDGCPGDDEDGDGIPDAKDKCPNEPETFNGVDDADGCPDAGKVHAELDGGRGIRVSDKIDFSQKARLDDESIEMLDAVAALLNAHAEIKKVRVAAHTEPSMKAKRTADLVLSQERARAVKKYLVKKGVAAARIEAVGYGGSLPVDKGDDATAREKNRRVELVIVERG